QQHRHHGDVGEDEQEDAFHRGSIRKKRRAGDETWAAPRWFPPRSPDARPPPGYRNHTGIRWVFDSKKQDVFIGRAPFLMDGGESPRAAGTRWYRYRTQAPRWPGTSPARPATAAA